MSSSAAAGNKFFIGVATTKIEQQQQTSEITVRQFLEFLRTAYQVKKNHSLIAKGI